MGAAAWNNELEMMEASKVYVNPYSDDDFFQLEHDPEYVSGLCFHLVISWIFAPGPKMLERVVKPLFRCIREFQNGYFKVRPISERVRNHELIPFENRMQIRHPTDLTTSPQLRTKEKLFAWHINSLLLSLNFILESVSHPPINSRNYLEADSGCLYVRVYMDTNRTTIGKHKVSNSVLVE